MSVNTKNNNILGISGMSGKSITGVTAMTHGVVVVFQFDFAGGPAFIKVKQGQVEVGGTNEWGTGTIQNF
jgi:hypothetical protein